ncbi:peptidoglycan DD-metalloendopeptidase family protein [Thermodesulfobacteriota bacterium]
MFFEPTEILSAQVSEIGMIAADRLNMRPEPGLNKPPLKTLRKGTKIKILRRLEGWLEIQHGDQVGYIRDRKQYVIILGMPGRKSDLSDDPDKRLAALKKEASTIGQEIETSRTEVQQFTEKEVAIIQNLGDIDQTLNNIVKNAAMLKSDLSGLESQIPETEKAIRILKKEIQTNEIYFKKRLITLYKMSWLGQFHILASADSVYEFFQRNTALAKILAYDERMRKTLTENKTRMLDLLESLRDQKNEKRILEAKLKQQIGRMYHERQNREKILENIREEKALKMAAIESLKQAAEDLDEKIKLLSVKFVRPGADNKDSSAPFYTLKGLLKMPVAGKIVTRFGQRKNIKHNAVSFKSGINIQADRGEPIRAVGSGRILYASWFKGFGNMIIIDHGDHYYTVYAHAEELFKGKDETVNMDEVIATVGDSGSLSGPALYFEVRHRGKPLNPLKWLEKS